MKKAAAKKTTTLGKVDEIKATGMFGAAMIDIGWRLFITMMVCLLGGRWLDQRFNSKPTFMLIGFGLLIASFVVIVHRVLKTIPKEFGGLKK